MSKWDELTMAEKAEMMKVAVRNGITKLQDIRDKYNEFAEGGGISDEEYYSTMEKVAEDNYQKWGLSSPDEALVHALNDNTYNYRGYYNKYPQSEANADTHWTDEFKTVYHPTFSVESSYSGQESQYNPQGLYGGHWVGDKFIPAPWQLSNTFKGGGYKPSASVKKRISTWEGAAMTGAIDPLSGKWGKNRSFEAEADSFYDALPASIRSQVLSNPELADNLFSYSYNVGAGNFKKRVVPALKKYYTGNGSPEEIANSMWATGDKNLRGLRNRRAVERKGVVDALTPAFIQEPADNTFMPNPFTIQMENTYQRPIIVPDEGSYVTAHEESPSEQRAQKVRESFDAINRFNALMNMLNMDTTAPTYTPDTGNPFLDAIGVLTNSNANGGKIHIKPENRGKFTALKKRTGHSATWFKEHGTPAQKKMAVFALNSRKWKHGLGGNLFDGTTQPSQKMQLGKEFWQTQAAAPTFMESLNEFNQKRKAENAALRAQAVAIGKEAAEKRVKDYLTTSNAATSVSNEKQQNQHLVERAVEGAKAHAAWEKDNPELAIAGNIAGAIPLTIASLPAIVPAGEALAETALGQFATKALTHPVTEAIGTSITGGHGLSDVFSGNANVLTALELTPLALPYGNFAKGTNEALNYIGSKIPTPVKESWAKRSETLAQKLGTEGKTWARVTDPRGEDGIVFLDNNDAWKGVADWVLHPQQTYRARSQGFYPITKKEWGQYLRKENKAMDFAKQKSIELNDAQLRQRLSLQPETFLDNKQRTADATIKIVDDPNNVFSWPRAPRNASEVANNVKVVSRNKDVSYGGKWFDPKFGTGTSAVSHPDKNVIVIPRHDQTKFSNMLMTMPSRGYTSPIDTRMHIYVHELQHQMQQNLPLLNLSQYNAATKYYVPYDHFLRNIDSENVLQPFKDTAAGDPKRYWYASPNEYNAEANAYRVVDDYKGKRNILAPLDSRNASRANIFGLNYDQTESLWNMGYKNGGKLRKKR